VQRPSGPLASNYGYSAFTALVTLLLVPLYVQLLGGAWGQLAICLTVQGLLFLADGTLSPLVLRDAARTHAASAWPEYRRFLRWYGAIAIALFLLGQAALLVGRQSIDAELLPSLRIALLQFVFQFANGAAIAFLIGRGRQREANVRLVAFAVAKHGAALSLLLFVPTATAYLAAFAAISAMEFVANHRRLRGERRASGAATAAAIDAGRGTALFVGASALGLMAGQIDRVYLALTQPVARYGVYYLVGSVLLSLLSLQVPAARTFLPLIATSERPHAVAASMLRVLAVTIIMPAIVTALFARTLLTLWLHDAAIAAEGAPVLRLLMLALVMNALYAPAGMLLVHAHRYAAIGAMNAAILASQAIVLYASTPYVGILAGAFSWLACGVIQLIVAIGVWHHQRGAIR
jgi:O-antigen/teichoic acid export membrane protein